MDIVDGRSGNSSTGASTDNTACYSRYTVVALGPCVEGGEACRRFDGDNRASPDGDNLAARLVCNLDGDNYSSEDKAGRPPFDGISPVVPAWLSSWADVYSACSYRGCFSERLGSPCADERAQTAVCKYCMFSLDFASCAGF